MQYRNRNRGKWLNVDLQFLKNYRKKNCNHLPPFPTFLKITCSQMVWVYTTFPGLKQLVFLAFTCDPSGRSANCPLYFPVQVSVWIKLSGTGLYHVASTFTCGYRCLPGYRCQPLRYTSLLKPLLFSRRVLILPLPPM